MIRTTQEPFRDRHREFQELVRELTLVRNQNLRIKEGDSQEKLLLYAESALVLMTLERFLRILPAVKAKASDTLERLLERATAGDRAVLQLPAKDRRDAIKRITLVRNTTLHGNFEQAAAQSKVKSVSEYFKTQFASEVESLYRLVDDLVRQIDPQTGQRYSGKK